MSFNAEANRRALNGSGAQVLTGISRGIEKEGLRVQRDSALLAQTPHPSALGSALTHPYITTDYSESLLEFITPVSNDIDASLTFLDSIQRFTASQLSDEMVWNASMPCIVAGESSIPIAHYGSSNVGQMKRVYRNGLGVRYGRRMQTIAGIHYNFSMPQAFWESAWQEAGSNGPLQDFVTEGYLGLIRNFFQHSWLLVYLLGASPAVCASFLAGNQGHRLERFDEEGASLYLPSATSLRMSDLGYTSNAQASLTVCYNAIDQYVTTLHSAIVTPYAPYSAFSITDNGEQAQLNDCLLQIENEFYSPIRPKRVTRSGEAPVVALKQRGIEYVEVRCIDINPFTPLGIDSDTICLLDTFLLASLLNDSPLCDDAVIARNKENLARVVNQGRAKDLMLATRDGERPARDLAIPIFEAFDRAAALLDDVHQSTRYGEAVAQARSRLQQPETTPSGRVLQEMEDGRLAFWQLASQYSKRWHDTFINDPLPTETQSAFEQTAATSLEQQAALDSATEIPFDQYLQKFYAQYRQVVG